jgi:hypothetical protein
VVDIFVFFMTENLGGGASSCMPLIPNFPKTCRVCNAYMYNRVEGRGDRHAGMYRCLQCELLLSGIRADVIHSSVQQTWTDLSFGADQLEVDLVAFADGTQLVLRSS